MSSRGVRGAVERGTEALTLVRAAVDAVVRGTDNGGRSSMASASGIELAGYRCSEVGASWQLSGDPSEEELLAVL